MKPQEFTDALPSDEEVAAKGICHGVGSCPCDDGFQCVALAIYGDHARNALKALSARKRLMVNRP